LSFIGGESVQVTLGISDKIAKVFQGILLFFLLACDTLILYRVRFETARAAAARAAG
jgi:simple sugar transport system permease protein